MSVGHFGSSLTDGDESRYKMCFGDLPNKTVYYHKNLVGDRQIDLTPKMREEAKSRLFSPEEAKALSTGSSLFATGTNYSATSGSIPTLVPTYVDPQLYVFTRRQTPLAAGGLPRVSNKSLFADYVKQTTLKTAKFKPELGALDETQSTYVRAAKPVKFMYSTGVISGPLLTAGADWNSALAYETEASYRSLKELEENTIINGNPTSGTVDGSTTDENAFTGLVQSITTNTSNMSSAAITLGTLRTGFKTIREAKGEPNLMVTDWSTYNDLKGILQEALRYPVSGSKDIDFGIENIAIDGVPIIPDLFMPTTATTRELEILDTRSIQLRVLQDATFEEGAKTNDSYKFWIKEYMTLLVLYEAWNYRVYNLA